VKATTGSVVLVVLGDGEAEVVVVVDGVPAVVVLVVEVVVVTEGELLTCTAQPAVPAFEARSKARTSKTCEPG